MGDHRNLINITDLSAAEIDHLIEIADDIIADPVKYQDMCAHKKLATLFFEPSTRTRLSFTAAMMELGGNAPFLVFDDAELSKRGMAAFAQEDRFQAAARIAALTLDFCGRVLRELPEDVIVRAAEPGEFQFQQDAYLPIDEFKHFPEEGDMLAAWQKVFVTFDVI